MAVAQRSGRSYAEPRHGADTLKRAAHAERWADKKMRYLLVVFVSLVVLWPKQALANMGLPMVAIYLPAAWLALVPIILIEAGYGVWRLGLPIGHALLAQAVANCVSTLIRIPVMWV